MSDRCCPFDASPARLIIQGIPQFAPTLQIKPEFWTVVEYPCQHQRRIDGNGTPVGAKLVDMLAGDAHGLGQPRLRQAQRRHELFTQNFSHTVGLSRCHNHVRSPIVMRIEIHISRLAGFPLKGKKQTPLSCYADGVQAYQRSIQLLKMVTRRGGQVAITGRVIEHLQAAEQTLLDVRRHLFAGDIVAKEVFQPLIAKTLDQRSLSALYYELLYRSTVHMSNHISLGYSKSSPLGPTNLALPTGQPPPAVMGHVRQVDNDQLVDRFLRPNRPAVAASPDAGNVPESYRCR